MALLSKKCVYGIRAVLFISAAMDEKEKSYVSIRTISDELDISFHFLTKILQTLTQHEFLRSYRGPKGGIQLARPAKEISLLDLLQAIEGPELLSACILGLPDCSDTSPCPLHKEWAGKRKIMKNMFSDTTLDQLTEGLRSSTFRINETGHLSFINP